MSVFAEMANGPIPPCLPETALSNTEARTHSGVRYAVSRIMAFGPMVQDRNGGFPLQVRVGPDGRVPPDGDLGLDIGCVRVDDRDPESIHAWLMASLQCRAGFCR